MFRNDKIKLFRWWGVFLLGLAPLIYLGFQILGRGLGPDPGEAITRFNGLWSMIILMISLAITPLNRLLKWRWAVQFRRMIGLYAWFYAVLHVTSGFLLVLDLSLFVEEITKRPYITVGMLAFVLLTGLAATSPKYMVRKLGKRWKSLHKSVYLIGLLVITHFTWQTRADYAEPVLYGAILLLLLGIRMYWFQSKRVRQQQAPALQS